MQGNLEVWVWLAATAVLTLVSMAWDFRERRIPNVLTIPAFFAGLIYQAAFHGWPGLTDAGLAFALGFGTLFLLWMLGGGAAGDVKLMGALGVWLGASLTLQVLFLSVVFVWLAAAGSFILRLFRKPAGTSAETTPPEQGGPRPKPRHMVAFAIPVGLATWLVMFAQIVKLQAAG